MFVDAADEGLIQKIRIDSNGTIPHPKVKNRRHPAVIRSGRQISSKVHLPVLWSPTDLKLPITYPCSMPNKCGISVDHRGYLPCPMAIGIVRTFKKIRKEYRGFQQGLAMMNRLKSESIGTLWNLDEICRHCVFAAPKEWKRAHIKKLNEITDKEKQPTKSWAKALETETKNDQT